MQGSEILINNIGRPLITPGLRVVICDDHPQMRSGVRSVLTGILGCMVVGETDKGEEAITLVERYKPDMLVLDLCLASGMSGRMVLSEIRRRHIPVKVFVHTAFLCWDDFQAWFSDPAGPDGIDEKGTGDRELALSFTQVLMTDQHYVPVRLVKKFMGRNCGREFDQLTPKELMVLKLAARPDVSTRQIAQRLGLSPSTVRVYLTAIYDKLGLEYHNRVALLAYCYDHQNEVAL
jgi:DNA-binding NarL/FixJ family response regulator